MNSDDHTPNYHEILNNLTKDWILLENRHRVSKSASEDFWRLASSAFPKLHKARIDEVVYKRVPQFQNQRKKMYDTKVPNINLKIGYKNLETDEISVVESSATPLSKYPPRKYQKLFEVATVKVRSL